MAKKPIKIKTISYVRVGNKLVNTEDLNEEQKLRLAKLLKVTYLNALFQGKARFFYPEDETFIESQKGTEKAGE